MLSIPWEIGSKKPSKPRNTLDIGAKEGGRLLALHQ